MEDLLTIALPVYKRTEYIRSAINSAVNQSVKCRVLIIDNNSPHDEFKKIAESYNNPLLKYIKTSETVPMNENFNNCIRISETPWLTILHDDDLLHCQFVELAQLILQKHQNKIGGFAVANQVSDKEWETGNQKIDFTDDIQVVKKPFFYFNQLSPFPGVMINKEVASKLGGFDAKHYPIEDYDFWYRYSTTRPMLYVNQELAFYRTSPSQDTVDYINIMINNVYQYRLRLMKEGKYNNLLTRLALEQSRINNINYYKRVYPYIKFENDLINGENSNIYRKLLKMRLISKIAKIYRKKISFGNIKEL